MKNTKQIHNLMANEKTKTPSASLGLEDISVLLETLEKHEVTEFKLERDGEKVWLRRGPQAPTQMPAYAAYPPQGMYQPMPQMNPQAQANSQEHSPNLTVLPGAAGNQGSSAAVNKNIKEVRSPMVGTFYRRPAVDAEPYVSVGDNTKKGSVLCIIEAMKLMNEIESEFSGKIVEVCLEDGQMVEYGEVLFKVEVA